MALVLLNRSCRQIRINSHLVEGDKVHTLNDCLQPLQRHLDWAPEHTSVVFAFGNVPILSMLGAPTGELQLNVDTTAVQINLKHEGTAGISLRPKNRFSCSLLECKSMCVARYPSAMLILVRAVRRQHSQMVHSLGCRDS
jgi:hypothetical protein